jgi:hypothetical protein
MKHGIARFEFYLQKLDILLKQAAKEHNPALWLFSNDARTPLFMLEALCRLYATLHNKKKFIQLKEHFKLLEDGLGVIDYYDNYAKIFLEHPSVPVHIREYMQAQTREKIQHLNEILHNKEWIGENPTRLKKIQKKLKEANWMQPKEETKALKLFYEDEIEDIKKFVKGTKGTFTQMESQVHELRRALRWLSIYPQALQGMIQLTDSGESEKNTQQYLIPEIVLSKYNVMPDAGCNTWFMLLEKNYFYALSWMIAEMGKLKDEGLQFFAITEALQQTEGLNHEDAYHKSFEVLGVEKDTIDKILMHASQITLQYIREENLDKMIFGLAHTQKTKGE